MSIEYMISMDGGLKALALALEIELTKAYEQLRVLEKFKFDELYNQQDKYFPIDFEYRKFISQLESLYRQLAFSLEVAGFKLTRQEFISGWKKYLGNLSETEIIHDVDVLNSEPLGYLGEYVWALKLFAVGEKSPLKEYQKNN